MAINRGRTSKTKKSKDVHKLSISQSDSDEDYVCSSNNRNTDDSSADTNSASDEEILPSSSLLEQPNDGDKETALQSSLDSFSDNDKDPDWVPYINKQSKTKQSINKKNATPKLHTNEFDIFLQMQNEINIDDHSTNNFIKSIRVDDSNRLISQEDDSDEVSSDEDQLSDGEITNQANKFFSEIQSSRKKKLKALKSIQDAPSDNRRIPNWQMLPYYLEPLMGRANVALALKKFSDVDDLCNEIIRQVPGCPEPYLLLGMMNEEMGDFERCFQFTLFGLHLKLLGRVKPVSEDSGLWKRMSEIAQERDDPQLALQCINKCVIADNQNIEALWAKYSLLRSMSMQKKAIFTLNQLSKLCLASHPSKVQCDIARNKSLCLFELGKSVEALHCIYRVLLFKDVILYEQVELYNLLLELYLISKLYEKAIKTFLILFRFSKETPNIDTDIEIDANIMYDDECIMEVEFEDTEIMHKETQQTTIELDATNLKSTNIGVNNPTSSKTNLESYEVSQENPLVPENENNMCDYIASKDKLTSETSTPESCFYDQYWTNSYLLLPQEDTESGFLVVVDNKYILISKDSFSQLPVDLLAKMAIPFLYTGSIDLSFYLIYESLEKLEISKYGNIWLDVIEAVIACSYQHLAIKLLKHVLECKEYNQPAVWLMLGNAHHDVANQLKVDCSASESFSNKECSEYADYMDNLTHAIDCYKHILSIIPNQVETRLRLSIVLEQCGRLEEAVEILKVPGSSDESHFLSIRDLNLSIDPPYVKVLNRKRIMLIESGNAHESLECALSMLDYFYRKLYTLKSFQLMPLMFWSRSNKTCKSFGKTIPFRKYKINEDTQQDEELTIDEWFDVFKNCCYLLASQNRFEDLNRLILAENVNKRLHNGFQDNDIFIITLTSCLIRHSYYLAYKFIKSYMSLLLTSNRFLLLIMTILRNTYLARNLIGKKIKLMLLQDPFNHRLLICMGGIYFRSTSFQLSLCCYHRAYRMHPHDPHLLMLMGLSLLGIARSRTTANKNHYLTQAIAYMFEYKKVRGECAESLYNIGRMYELIGLKHWASRFYNKVLALPLPVKSHWNKTKIKKPSFAMNLYSLKREAAFNLSIIYEASGSIELARYILNMYCNI